MDVHCVVGESEAGWQEDTAGGGSPAVRSWGVGERTGASGRGSESQGGQRTPTPGERGRGGTQEPRPQGRGTGWGGQEPRPQGRGTVGGPESSDPWREGLVGGLRVPTPG